MPTSKARPATHNDDLLWLLQRIAGLTESEGKGTESDGVVRGIPSNDVLHYISGSHLGIDGTGEITLQLPTTTRNWMLVGMSYNRTAGAGANIAPRVGQVVTFVADSGDDRLTFASQVVADRINSVFASPIPFHVDAAFKAYFRPQYDAGADNTGDYQFWFIQGYETEESS